MVQVKGGKVGAKDVRDFRGVIDRENAAIGILISLDEPTAPMRAEAATLASYASPFQATVVPRLQIVTIAQLLGGGTPSAPSGVTLPRGTDADRTVKKAERFDAGALFLAQDSTAEDQDESAPVIKGGGGAGRGPRSMQPSLFQ